MNRLLAALRSAVEHPFHVLKRQFGSVKVRYRGLLRGSTSAGICPVCGHSNVQGQRTVGITETPALVPLDRSGRQYAFEPPREPGMNTVEACEAILAGRVRAFLSSGGNSIRALPETAAMEAAWRSLRLSAQISIKLNRIHLIHGEVSVILPCLGRIERDRQASGPRAVTMLRSSRSRPV